MPALIIPSMYILMNIIAQKYVFKPSAIKSGENTSHHPEGPKKQFSSNLRASNIVKNIKAIKLIHISKIVKPNQ